jgi:hypothetical protein
MARSIRIEFSGVNFFNNVIFKVLGTVKYMNLFMCKLPPLDYYNLGGNHE